MVNLATEQLLRRAEAELGQVSTRACAEENFLHAHMAGLRAGAAVLALHPHLAPRRRGAVRSVWAQLAEIDESWQSWAALFSAGAPIRAAIESGRDSGLTQAQAARTAAAATDFVAMVAEVVAEAAQIPAEPRALAS